jgi:hypothetical protein
LAYSAFSASSLKIFDNDKDFELNMESRDIPVRRVKVWSIVLRQLKHFCFRLGYVATRV